MSNPTSNANDKDDDTDVHQSIPTLGEERFVLDIPDFEEDYVNLPTLEELEEETKKYLDTLSQRELKDQTEQLVPSAEQHLGPEQSNAQSKLMNTDMEGDDEDIEQIVLSISAMLSKHKDYILK